MSAPHRHIPASLPPTPSIHLRPILVLILITLLGVASVFAMWWYFSTDTKAQQPTSDPVRLQRVDSNK